MNKELPVYELRINPTENSLVNAIALVNEPAIESNFIAFSKVEALSFALDDERRELLGAAMIPNQKIYRRDKDGTEYYVFFSEETIRQIAQVFFEKGFQKNMNLEHSNQDANTTIFQSYIVDEQKGLSSPKDLDLPNGSWVIGAKINDEQVWNSIKKGERKGFSVEGMFQFFNSHKQNEDVQILETLQQLNKLINKKK